MSFDGEDRRWICGRGSSVNLQLVSSIVREIREPCLHHSPTKMRMLKPEKWQSIFDGDGKIYGFRKALKSIVYGGVDPSIRAEVWEFLLGCYALGSTAEDRRQLRMARRDRYMELIRECQSMHSSIGTGTLAYVVGSKLMDMRTSSKDNNSGEAVTKSRGASQDTSNNIEASSSLSDCTDTSYACQRKSSTDLADLVSVRGGIYSDACDSSCAAPSSHICNSCSRTERNVHEMQHATVGYFDFPPLPVTNLFQKSEVDEKDSELDGDRLSEERKTRSELEHMHSFQINNNVDLIIEVDGLSSTDVLHTNNHEAESFSSNVPRQAIISKQMSHKSELVNRLRISDVPEASTINPSALNGVPVGEDRVSEWLWTLHRIVVDVVRTDSHLEFYEDTKNMARMSDILAVYAWVDPATGYCQGMSDLLSPFVVLYEDNADAFWCFEMLLRRMRENFQMEGPTGVMKQLQALWKILELTDAEMYAHLSLIGAESLHFAFRMLLVLFRRELSFNEALCMWEMMWAADYDEAMAQELEENCLEPLVLQIPRDLGDEMVVESMENGPKDSKCMQSESETYNLPASAHNGVTSALSQPFCGLTRANFWARHDHPQICTMSASTRNGDDELPVFCVAAILIMNRQKIIRETHSIDDVIKIFNDNLLKIKVKRCVRMAIKLRKKYFYKLIKQTNLIRKEEFSGA
ncbi:hypothetical protein QJS10_CPB04g01939 [Acorus calamus]|uniref:Rab-GAP TBC domain-containing protein n=1 Tax=Acorus calamus TaxID=4465 RepID=A0AAV9F1V4_ACOCL|nr:hypothetical protein QJS10_CPB04g01939 [Acorus calamus]